MRFVEALGSSQSLHSKEPKKDRHSNFVTRKIVSVSLAYFRKEPKKDRHSNFVTRKIVSVSLAYFRYYQRTPDRLHIRRFAEKLRIGRH